ncbi:MAG: hypothetical protein DBX55_04440 [Verrucomicrobia bacterium]|nr:MAG: hypothetical protein DBX55_04440 [Verrucomicrobiota bacterium]
MLPPDFKLFKRARDFRAFLFVPIMLALAHSPKIIKIFIGIIGIGNYVRNYGIHRQARRGANFD